MAAASLPLSAHDLRYLHDTDFLSAKHRIQKALQHLLEEAQRQLTSKQHTPALPDEVWKVAAKISRGENYRLLPYLVLDYPRIFQRDATFAYRTMVWWGHEISCTLQLGGSYWQQYRHSLLQKLEGVQEENWWVCVHRSPWEYHFGQDNYRPLQELQATNALATFADRPFFKLSRKLPLENYQELPAFCSRTFSSCVALLNA